MQVSTRTVHVHALPLRATAALHSDDRDIAGVYGVDVDSADYPSHQATAALNAFRASVSLRQPGDFLILVLDPATNYWLSERAEPSDFPCDGEFLGRQDVDLLPVGMTLVSKQDERDDDESGKERLTPAGAQWQVLAIDQGTVQLGCEDTGASIFASICEVGGSFVVFNNYAEDADLSAEQLDDKYNPTGGGEHPMHNRRMWREAVSNEDTISGYWNWVESEIAQTHWSA